MNIEYLHYFLDVAKTKSITQAAKLNFISPQGMSRAMGEFEKELGCDLLIRYSNKLELSPVGEELIEPITRVVDAYSDLIDSAMEKSRPHPSSDRSLVFDCQNIGTLAFLTDSAKSYIFESKNIHFRESDNSQIRQNILAHRANADKDDGGNPFIGLMCFFSQDQISDKEGISDLTEEGFVYRPYMKSFDKVMVAASSPLASRKSLSDKEITSKPLVTTNTALRNVLAKRFGNHAISLSSTDFSLRKRMVESGAAHSFLPAFAPLTIDSNGKFVLCDMQCPYELEIGFIGTKEGFESEAFLELVRILDGFYEKHLDTGLYTLYR